MALLHRWWDPHSLTGIKLMLPASGVWSLNCLTIREVPGLYHYSGFSFLFLESRDFLISLEQSQVTS